VVDAARARGHEVAPLARATGVDIIAGTGWEPALTGADALIDVSNMTTLSTRAARRFFETATRRLLDAEQTTGVRHHVALSIVGIDDIDTSYYAGKLAQERAVEAGPVPFTIARAGQFHEFAAQLLSGMRGPIAVMPRTLMRPVAAAEVAARLVDIAEGAPQGRAADFVGPCDEVLADLARRQLAHHGIRRRVVEIKFPGAYGRGLASGALRGGAGRIEGATTFDEWLRAGSPEERE
jgi:hypothetical protein